MSLWDTAGSEEYDKLRPLSYPSTDVFIICFSVIEPSSLVNVTNKWYYEITSSCPEAPVVLVGTKVELRDSESSVEALKTIGLAPVTRELGEAAAKKIHAVKYLECSAYTQMGLREVFDVAVRSALARWAEIKEPKKKNKCKCELL